MTILEPPRDAGNVELLAFVFDRINAHDVPSLRKVWTPETKVWFPDATCIGDDQIAAYFDDKIATIADLRLDVVAIVGAGDDGFVHWRMTGTHTGRVVGVDGTGRAIDLPGMDHFVVADGNVVTNTVVFDQLEFARQIGLLPRDGSRIDRLVKATFNLTTRRPRRRARPGRDASNAIDD